MGRAGVQRNLVPVPNGVNVVSEIQVSPLQELLLLVHGFGDDIREVVRHAGAAIDHGAGAHYRRDRPLDAAVQPRGDDAALLFAPLANSVSRSSGNCIKFRSTSD